RKNQEVFGTLDFHDGGEVPLDVLREILDFIRSLSELAPGVVGESGPKARLHTLLDGLTAVVRRWSTEASRRAWPRVVPVLLGPGARFSAPIPERLGQ